jgi:hypothetical protein
VLSICNQMEELCVVVSFDDLTHFRSKCPLCFFFSEKNL